MQNIFKPLVANQDRLSANEWNKLTEMVARHLNSLVGSGMVNREGVYSIPQPLRTDEDDENILAWYQFNGNAEDNSGNDLDGTLNGNATVARDVYEGDGANSYMDCGTDFIGTGDITVSCGFRAVSLGGSSQARIIDNGKFIIRVLSVAEFVQVSSDGGSTWRSSAALAFDYHEWTHLAVTRTAAGVSSVYINGALSGTPGTSGTPAAGSTNVFVGDDGTHAFEWDGALDDVRIYNTILELHEIRRLVEHGHKRYFHANESFGTAKIFEVQSVATGDGIYNCYEQTLDATEWADTGGDDRFDDRNTTSVEVFHLAENHVAAAYTRGLARYDRMRAWRKYDDEGKARWVGESLVPGPKLFRLTEDAPGGDSVTCNAILNNGNEASSSADILYNIEVYGNFHNAAVAPHFDDSAPLLEDDQYLLASHIRGKWYCTGLFAGKEPCDCFSS